MAQRTKKTDEDLFRDALLMVSPGTPLREGISLILQSGTGALLAIGDPKKMAELSEGGVKVDTKCTPQLLYELSKMDGGLVLNKEASKIIYANRFFKPDTSITSNETGMRHRTAERLARQSKCTVVAVSERRASVTLYVSKIKYRMDNIATVMNKAIQAIQTLEKYARALRQALQDLTSREFQDMVTITDVCRVIQRYEMLERLSKEIEPFIVELGTEGRSIALQRNELIAPAEEASLVVKDYARPKAGNYDAVMERLSEIEEDSLLDLTSMSQALGYGTNMRGVDAYLTPRGYRILSQTHRLTNQIIEGLISQFGTLQQIIRAPKEDLVKVEGVGEVLAERIRVSLNLLRNQIDLSRR